MGWSYNQVFSLWSVNTRSPKHSDWSLKSIEEIGGKGALGNIWAELKDEGKARMEKRKTPEDLELRKSSPVKFRKIVEACSPTKSKAKNTLTNSFKHRQNGSPCPVQTPELPLRPVQMKMTSWINSSKKIGSKPDISLPKKNPNPLIPPCGPKKTSRKLFNMKDSPEELETTLAIAESIASLKSPVSADSKKKEAHSTSPGAPSPVPAAQGSRTGKNPTKKPAVPTAQANTITSAAVTPFPAPPAAASAPLPAPPAVQPARGRKKEKTRDPSDLACTPNAPEDPRKPQEIARNPKKTQPTVPPLAKPKKDAAISKLPALTASSATIATSQKEDPSPQQKEEVNVLKKKTANNRKLDRSKFHSHK